MQELLHDLGAELLFTPPASSILNSIEVLWAVVKSRWRNELLEADPAVQGQSWMESTLGTICRSVSPVTLENLWSAHLKEAVLLIREAVQYYDEPRFIVDH